MREVLDTKQLSDLHRICRKFGVDVALIDKVTSRRIMSREVDLLCEVINNEFLTSGIDKDFEANDYGREMEALLDAVNAVRLRPSG